MRALPLCLLLLAAPATAQEAPATALSADLDGDGRAESYALVPGADQTADLQIAGPEGARRVADVAWDGGMAGQEASLALSPAGSLQILSGNDAIGRDRWRLTVTVAHRGGGLKVAGLTYERRDTLDPEGGWAACDLNLLSGRGTIADAGGERALVVAGPAPALADGTEARAMDLLPPECLG